MTRGIARVDPRRLDVLEDAGHPRRLAVAEGVDVELARAREEAVDQARAVRHDVVRGPRDPHPAAAEHVVRAHQHQVADALGGGARLVGVRGHGPLGRAEPRRAQDLAEPAAVLGGLDRREGAPRSGTPAASRSAASRSGVCPPKDTTTPAGRSSAQTSRTRSRVTGSR